ncbi:uncharacterized protein L199_005837 [Kwoniella botswanensis]|uniref:uncharacterized protein n=1 Tax=Kwoniella botswanensis TaxID=1268659 RepID=UPI00315DB514
MAFKLEPIEIVAICLASFAVLLITFYALYKLTKSCRTSSSASTTPIHESRNQYGYGGGNGYGYDHGGNAHNPFMNYPYSAGSSSKGMGGRNTPTPIPTTIQPSPSTGHTTLVTPSTASGGKNGHKLKKGGIGLIHSPWQSSNKDKEKVDMEEKTNDELVVVTYEDGLRKLGIQPIREIPQGPQGGVVNQYRNVPPINTNVSFVNPNPNPNTNLYTPASTITPSAMASSTRPEMVERESSRRTYHSVAGRGHGAGRRGHTNTMGTMGSNLLPSYYIETNAGDD